MIRDETDTVVVVMRLGSGAFGEVLGDVLINGRLQGLARYAFASQNQIQVMS